MPTEKGQVGVEACRNWIEDATRGSDHCNKPAKYIVWGKLFPKEHLGPRCEDCALDQVGYNALRPDAGYAIYRLPEPPQQQHSVSQRDTTLQLSREDGERLERIAEQIDYALETRSQLDPEAENDAAFLRQLSQGKLSQPPQDDVEGLREKLLGGAVRAECEEALDLLGGWHADQDLGGMVDAVLGRAVEHLAAAPDVERLGGEEGLREALEAEVERQCREVGVLSEAAQRYPVGSGRRAAYRAKHEAVSNERDRLQAILDANPSPAPEHSKGGLGEPVKRLSAEEIEQVAADAARKAAPIFAAEGWEWTDDDDHREVPGEDRIRRTISGLARGVQTRMRDGGDWICTGRFYVALDVEDGEEVLSVLLMLTMNGGELIASTRPQHNQGSDQPKEEGDEQRQQD